MVISQVVHHLVSAASNTDAIAAYMGLRDLFIIVLGFFHLFRRSEIV